MTGGSFLNIRIKFGLWLGFAARRVHHFHALHLGAKVQGPGAWFWAAGNAPARTENPKLVSPDTIKTALKRQFQ